LVEEPEAHLHPQLQAAVLCFLEEQADKSRTVSGGYDGPAGQLQVIVATHSPNLSAWVSSEKMVYFRSVVVPGTGSIPIESKEADLRVAAAKPQDDTDSADLTTTAKIAHGHLGIEELAEVAECRGNTSVMVPDSGLASRVSRRLTRCIPLRALALENSERRKVDRYLDVTKSALLFGGRVLLVEGIAEALLLPIIAQRNVLKGDHEKIRIFRSAVFVPIEGVDFACYLRLLLTPYKGVRIADRVVVITDGDRTKQLPGVETPGQRRKAEYEKIAQDLNATGVFDAVINTYSLETELVNAGNATLMKQVYLKFHPNSELKWDEALALTGDDRAEAVQALFNNTPKGDFAQLLAEAIRDAATFTVPTYIRTAIEALVQ